MKNYPYSEMLRTLGPDLGPYRSYIGPSVPSVSSGPVPGGRGAPTPGKIVSEFPVPVELYTVFSLVPISLRGYELWPEIPLGEICFSVYGMFYRQRVCFPLESVHPTLPCPLEGLSSFDCKVRLSTTQLWMHYRGS